MIWAAAAAGVIVLLSFAAALWWLADARYKAGRAEAESHALKRGRKARSNADEIMAEPTADESAWISGVRQRQDSDH